MSKQIGIITNDHTQVFQRDVITGVREYVEARNYTVQVVSLTETTFNLDALTAFDGVLAITNVLKDDELNAICEMGKPMTLVSHWVRNLPIPAIVQNNTDGIRQLVDYLVLNCGRRDIAFIGGDMRQHDGRQRKQTFLESMLRHDVIVPESHLLEGDFIPDVAAASLHDFLEAEHHFDAVLAADFLMGVAAVEVLRAEHVTIPDAVCVVGFGDGAEAEAAGLTTVGADVIEMGRHAARQLLAQIEGQRFTGITWLNTELLIRKTS